MNVNIDISVSEYDDTDIFVVVKRGKDNLYMEMGICQFIDEMEYWGMPAKGGVLNGEAGYIFSGDIEIELEDDMIKVTKPAEEKAGYDEDKIPEP